MQKQGSREIGQEDARRGEVSGGGFTEFVREIMREQPLNVIEPLRLKVVKDKEER